MNNPYMFVAEFENTVAERFNAHYGIATDCCTHAIFLAARYRKLSDHLYYDTSVYIPKHTYVSVPQYLRFAGYNVVFRDVEWKDYYEIAPLKIIDAAKGWRRVITLPGLIRDGYTVCLSFHAKKHIPIGRGGMILTNDHKMAEWCYAARHDGRGGSKSQIVSQEGYHFYMTPEQAARGMTLIQANSEGQDVPLEEYPDCSQMPFFRGRT